MRYGMCILSPQSWRGFRHNENLKEAHAYAYGGAVLQDLGYYPRGNKFFSDLTHYVRTGQFVETLLADAANADEYAFALGALTHYFGDTIGHSRATNIAEAEMYPRLGRRFGKVIYYYQDPSAHVRTEFSFDVVEVAHGNFAPQAYHDFIGFSVATPLLTRAMRETYGIEFSIRLFPHFDLSLGSFRYCVSKAIPTATRIAWAQDRDEIEKVSPGVTRRRFEYTMRRSSYERNWGKQYDRPSFIERVLAVPFSHSSAHRAVTKPAHQNSDSGYTDAFYEELYRCDERVPAFVAEGTASEQKSRYGNDPDRAGAVPVERSCACRTLAFTGGKRFWGNPPGMRSELLDFCLNPICPSTPRSTSEHGPRYEPR